MRQDQNEQIPESVAVPGGHEQSLTGRAPGESCGPQVSVQRGLEGDHRAHIGDSLPVHHAGETSSVDACESGDASQAFTCLEYRHVAGLDKARDRNGVVGGIGPERSGWPFPPTGEPRIGWGITTGHALNSGVYRGCLSAFADIKTVGEVLHMYIAASEHACHETTSDSGDAAASHSLGCGS